MSSYVKTYESIAPAIITQSVVLPNVEIKENPDVPYFHTANAVWDTGAELTIIKHSIVERLHLQPAEKSAVEGIGGVLESNIYQVHIGLPNGDLIRDVEVMEMPDETIDYDVIIGMDIISECDVAITHRHGKTKFTFDRPASRDIDFTLA